MDLLQWHWYWYRYQRSDRQCNPVYYRRSIFCNGNQRHCYLSAFHFR